MFLHICFVHTLLLLSYIYIYIFFLYASFFCGKLMFHIVQCDIVHDVSTFAGRATTQHGRSHKVIQVLYIDILSIMPNHTVCVDLWCCLRSLGQLKRRAAVQKSATGGWWLFSCCRIWWNYAEMHCSKYVLLLVDPAFQTLSLFTW